MPIYEYRCADCGKRTSLFVLNLKNPPPLACKFCQGIKLERILSKFAAPKSEEARLERLADPSNLGDMSEIDENEPRSMARFMKKMGSEIGEDFDEDIEEALEEAGNNGEESDQ